MTLKSMLTALLLGGLLALAGAAWAIDVNSASLQELAGDLEATAQAGCDEGRGVQLAAAIPTIPFRRKVGIRPCVEKAAHIGEGAALGGYDELGNLAPIGVVIGRIDVVEVHGGGGSGGGEERGVTLNGV